MGKLIKTSRGQIVDFESLLAKQGSSPAVGNTGTDAHGNIRDPKGNITKPAEVRVREYYNDNPQASSDKVSLKGKPSETAGGLKPDKVAPEVKTAKTAKENERTKVQPDTQPEPTPPTGENFDEQEPLGYKEVELPNGDIEMVPYYTEEDGNEDQSI